MKTKTKPEKKEVTTEAIQAEVNGLKKLIENCVPKNYKFPKMHRFNAVAGKIVDAVFLTVNVFTPIESKSSGRYDEQHKKFLWKDLEQAIFNADNLGDYWTRPEFRRGVELVTTAHNELNSQLKWNHETNKYDRVDPGDITQEFIFCKPEITRAAIECLLEVIPKLKLNAEDELDLMLSLSTILFVLKLDGMDRSTDDDENED